MMPDLLPTHPQTNTSARHRHAPVNAQSFSSKSAVVSPESPGLSRAAQQAAAAAAAVSHVRDSAQIERSTNSFEKRDLNDDLDKINALAMEQVQSGDYEQALDAFTQVLQIQQRAHGDAHPTVASAHHNLGTVHAKRAALLKEDSRSQKHCRSQALECFQAAARVARDSLGKNHPNVAVSLVRIGFLLLQSRQYANAAVTFQEALRIRLVCYGPKHGLVANLYNNLGVCHMHLKDFEKGKQQLEQALEIQRHIVQENTKDSLVHRLELAETLFNIGGLCLEWIRRQGPHVGRAKDAVAVFQEALNVRFLLCHKFERGFLTFSLFDLDSGRSSRTGRLYCTTDPITC
jgi:tetratricopeptide (TPR) repeat protein